MSESQNNSTVAKHNVEAALKVVQDRDIAEVGEECEKLCSPVQTVGCAQVQDNSPSSKQNHDQLHQLAFEMVTAARYQMHIAEVKLGHDKVEMKTFEDDRANDTQKEFEDMDRLCSTDEDDSAGARTQSVDEEDSDPCDENALRLRGGGCDRSQSSNLGLDMDYIQQELLKERRDVEMAEDLAQKRRFASLKPAKLEDIQKIDPPEMSPTMLARFMHMEQRGLPTTSPPHRFANVLFPGVKEPLSTITAVTSPAGGVAVPVKTKDSGNPIPESVRNDITRLEASFRATQKFESWNGTMMQTSEQDEYSGDGMVMWEVTGVSHYNHSINPRRDSLVLTSPELGNFNLEAAAPAHHTRVQLRGSCQPWWFPGYYSSLPGIDGIGLGRSPSTTLAAAHNAFRPQTFNPESHIVVEAFDADADADDY